MAVIPGDYHGDEHEIDFEINQTCRTREEWDEDYYNDRIDEDIPQ